MNRETAACHNPRHAAVFRLGWVSDSVDRGCMEFQRLTTRFLTVIATMLDGLLHLTKRDDVSGSKRKSTLGDL